MTAPSPILVDLLALGVPRFTQDGTALVGPGGVTGPFKFNGTVYASEYGIVSDATLDQTAAIQAMIVKLSAASFGGELIWPAGDICFTGPIDWSGCGAPSRTYYQTTDTRITPPSFKSTGTGSTRFRMLNAANTNSTGFIFSITDAQAALGLTRLVAPKFANCDFYGPGLSIQKTTLSGDAQVGVSFNITGALAAVGDAICLISGSKRHWATVASISGASPQQITVDTRQALLSIFTAAATTSVLLFKQSRLLQLGGTRTAGSTTVQEVKLDNVRFFSAFQGLCIDDTTLLTGKSLVFQHVTHNIAYGYNCDAITLDTPYVGTDKPLLTATCTNGSAVVTANAAGNGASIVVGEKVYENPNADGTLNFPEHTYVLSVSYSSPTYTITLSEPYAGTTGSKSLNVVDGILIVNGQSGTAFLGNYASNTLNNYTATVINNPICGRIEKLIDNCDTVGQGMTINGGYLEACQRIFTHGMLGGSGSGGPFSMTNLVVQGIDSCSGPGFEDFLGGISKWDIKVSGIGSTRFPVFQSRSNNPQVRLREGWAWNNTSTAAKGYGQVSPSTINLSTSDNNTAVAVATGTEWSYNTGNFGKSEGRGATITNGAYSGGLNWNWPGVSALDLTLAGNLTAGSIIYGMPTKGYELQMWLKQDATGTRTVTLGGDFVKGDGTSMGTIAAGTAAQTLMMRFLSNGSHLVLQGNQTPAFI